MIRDRDLIGYIPDNTHGFICIHCSDKTGVDLENIGEEENTPILYGDDWKHEVGPCGKCGIPAGQVTP